MPRGWTRDSFPAEFRKYGGNCQLRAMRRARPAGTAHDGAGDAPRPARVRAVPAGSAKGADIMDEDTAPARYPRPVLLAVDDDAHVLRAVRRDLRREYGDRYRVLT